MGRIPPQERPVLWVDPFSEVHIIIDTFSAKVALEAGNNPQMIFRYYRELRRPMDAEKWFGMTPDAVETAKAARRPTGRSRAMW